MFLYCICVTIKCADTGCVPTEFGVIVSAAAFADGFLNVKTEFIAVVCTIAIPIICEVPVAPIFPGTPCIP